jgi:Cft2 family RNA processing exonuclease
MFSKNREERLEVVVLGAASSIGASCFQILIGPYEVILDCGLRQKGSKPLPAFELLKKPDLLLISHAHQDHLGALPYFHSLHPGVPMVVTPPTKEIAQVMLKDALKIQQQRECGDSPSLFNEHEMEKSLFHLGIQHFGTDFEPLPGLKVRFIKAGHILGAACIWLRYGNRSLFYTGDFHIANSPTTEGLKLEDLSEIKPVDMLITEGTYGNAEHASRKKQERELIESVYQVISAGGNVLIPAFALGRAQEIILAIKNHQLFNSLKIPVYVDGLVRSVTQVFRENIEYLPQALQNSAREQEPFFNPEGSPPVIPIASGSERALAMAKPSVIIASSGMLTEGSPSFQYASVLLERENAAIFLNGYTDEESPGRRIQSFYTGQTTMFGNKEITIQAAIKRFNLSAHADKLGIHQIISALKPSHLILVHGERKTLYELACSSNLRDRCLVHIPKLGENIMLGERPISMSPEQFQKINEGSVEYHISLEDNTFEIPQEILEDPRWKVLQGNGVIAFRWKGTGLEIFSTKK